MLGNIYDIVNQRFVKKRYGWNAMKSLREALGEIQDDRARCRYPFGGLVDSRGAGDAVRQEQRQRGSAVGPRVPVGVCRAGGFPRGRTPSLGTFQRVIAAVDDEELARVVGHWGEDALPAVHVLVLVEIGSRRVHLAGCTPIRTMPGLRNKRGK
jgi:hypothetical protein